MKKQIATIGFRIASIYLLLSSVSNVVSFGFGPTLARGDFLRMESIGLLVGILVVLGISILTWRFAKVLPERLLGIKEQNLNNHQIATVSIKIIGLYVVFRAIEGLPWLFSYMPRMDIYSVLGVSVFVIWALAGTLAWRFADNLASLITRDMKDIKSTPAKVLIDIDLLAVALGVIGVFVLVDAIPVIVNELSEKWLASFLPQSAETFMFETINVTHIVTSIIKIIIGLWLIFGGFKLSRLLRSFRDYGLDLSEENKMRGDESTQ